MDWRGGRELENQGKGGPGYPNLGYPTTSPWSLCWARDQKRVSNVRNRALVAQEIWGPVLVVHGFLLPTSLFLVCPPARLMAFFFLAHCRLEDGVSVY